MGSPRCTPSRKRSPEQVTGVAHRGMGARRARTSVAKRTSSRWWRTVVHRSHSFAVSRRRGRARSPGIAFPVVANDAGAERASQLRRGGPQRCVTTSRGKTAATVGEVESRLPASVGTGDFQVSGHRGRTGRSVGAGTCASCLRAKRRYLRRRTQPLLQRDGRGSLDVKRVGHWSAAGDAKNAQPDGVANAGRPSARTPRCSSRRKRDHVSIIGSMVGRGRFAGNGSAGRGSSQPHDKAAPWSTARS